MRPDPIPHEVQARILDAAIRAPNGANFQQWRFLLVDDPALKAQLGTLYRACHDQIEAGFLAERIARAHAAPDAPSNAAYLRTHRSSQHLAHHFAEVPLLLFCFDQGQGGAATYPAAWSAMLAAGAEGSAARSPRSWGCVRTRC